MAQGKDVLAKLWFQTTPNSFFVRRILGVPIDGEPIVAWEPTEFPRIQAKRADLICRTVDGRYTQIEFMASNEAFMHWRMAEYRVLFALQAREGSGGLDAGLDRKRDPDTPLRQILIYIGRDPCTMKPGFEQDGFQYSYELFNLRDMAAEELLASPNWDDQLWALVARGDAEAAMHKVLGSISRLSSQQRQDAMGRLGVLSGILKLEEVLRRKLEGFPMLDFDLRNNPVFRPILEEQRIKARDEGRVEGRVEGQRATLLSFLTKKFGQVPDGVKSRVQAGSEADLDMWIDRILDASTAEDVVR
jgi:hypothetical protein